MAKEFRMVVLHYSKDKRETIENIINMESVVAQQTINHGSNVGESAPEPKLFTRRNPKIEETLYHIHRALRYVDCEKDTNVTRHFLLVRDALQSLRNDGVKPVPIIDHSCKEDFRSRISELMDVNQKLSGANKVLEKANNESISEVEAKEIELSTLEDELKRMRDNKSQLKSVEENLEASLNTTDKALKVLSSLKEKDRRYWEGYLRLKEELKACRAERKEIIKDSKRQNEAWERKHAKLVDRNEYPQGKITGFKRKLGDAMEDIDNGTRSKKRQGS
ncbi:predicted protein [Sclerotinia sclerotiorum 1980 UF-70]|uniref:Uncharacterized protein n=2 Tax=Sclerotinia sclerotiorum (strain ATCC 18683 / 1980 / Ss-1) TaxID=665079 RepID=A7F6M2_SCLS1|nr:predicted protein [Sclerotinia sclerotiorum 1980 UF-70]APA08325.1 hypothetical protein sscle_03g030950 [Sclerotinia sclerotiorum 1980 UF-70]EDN98393.1 predicted protein [Sclerotinia sclerotiorum 1980 UF-70]